MAYVFCKSGGLRPLRRSREDCAEHGVNITLRVTALQTLCLWILVANEDQYWVIGT